MTLGKPFLWNCPLPRRLVSRGKLAVSRIQSALGRTFSRAALKTVIAVFVPASNTTTAECTSIFFSHFSGSSHPVCRIPSLGFFWGGSCFCSSAHPRILVGRVPRCRPCCPPSPPYSPPIPRPRSSSSCGTAPRRARATSPGPPPARLAKPAARGGGWGGGQWDVGGGRWRRRWS